MLQPKEVDDDGGTCNPEHPTLRPAGMLLCPWWFLRSLHHCSGLPAEAEEAGGGAAGKKKKKVRPRCSQHAWDQEELHQGLQDQCRPPGGPIPLEGHRDPVPSERGLLANAAPAAR